jgi:energy-coupling factor transporter transmembrane protein EcfT
VLFAIIVIVLYAVVSSADASRGYWSFGPLSVSRAAGLTGLRLGLTFVSFVVLARSLLLYATPSGLAAGLTWCLRPLKLIGLKPELVYSFVFVTLRLIPGLLAESETIRLAQRSRGWRPGGGWWRGVRHARAILIPVFAAAMRRAESLSIVLSSRGITFDGTPGAVRALHFRLGDALAAIGAVALVTAALYLRLR